MIQDIAPHQYDNCFAHRRAPRPTDFVFFHRNEKEILLKKEENGFRFPTIEEVGTEGLYFAFLIDDTAFFVGPDRGAAPMDLPGFEYTDQGKFRTLKPQHLAFAGITGMQLMRWLASERYCGSCGTPLEESSWERAFVCPKCKKTTYPRLMPAVIIGVMQKRGQGYDLSVAVRRRLGNAQGVLIHAHRVRGVMPAGVVPEKLFNIGDGGFNGGHAFSPDIISY